jgi:hypothetical protein
MSELATPEAERSRIGRRTLIKRAAATGAVAWTAPLILDSLTSPAAALTCGTCFRVTFPADSGGACDLPSVTVATAGICAPTTTGPGCLTPTDLPAGTTYGAACIVPPGFCATTSNRVAYALNQAAACFSGGNCAPNRRYLAGRAQLMGGSPSPRCVDAAIDVPANPSLFIPAPPNAVFTGRVGAETWVNFTLVIGCSCS